MKGESARLEALFSRETWLLGGIGAVWGSSRLFVVVGAVQSFGKKDILSRAWRDARYLNLVQVRVNN